MGRLTFSMAGMAPMAGMALAATIAAGPDDEAVYRARFAALMHDGGVVTRYDPLEAMPGRMRPMPVATPAPRRR